MDAAPKVNTGVPTVGVVVTIWVEVLGPLQPVAVAVIVELPDQAAAKVTTPVAGFIEFVILLAGSRL